MSHEGHAADTPGPGRSRAPGGRRAALAARLRVLSFLGLGPGLVEGAALISASDAPRWGLVAAGVALGLWMVVAVVLGLPFLFGALALDARRNEAADPAGRDRPGPLANAIGLGLSLLPGLAGAVALTALLAPRVAPATRPYLGLALGAVLPAISALAAPTLVGMAASAVPRKLRRPALRFVFLLAVAVGAATFVEDVDDRLLPLLGALPAAGLAGLGGRALRVGAFGALLLAPLLGGLALQQLEHAPTEHARAPSTAGLLYGAVLPALEALSDDDGDGHGDAFGGDDCDDDDRTVHPGARDIPRNKKDDNCRGGDLVHDYERARLAGGAAEIVPAPAGVTGSPASGEGPGVGAAGRSHRDADADGDADAGDDRGAGAETGALAEPDRPHIVLLVIDSLRFDAFGPGPGLTPNIDRLAAAGTRFDRAYAPSSATRFSITALLAGRWMAHTRYEEKLNVYELDASVSMLQVQLRDRGYRTGAIVPAVPHTQMPKLRRGFYEFNVIDSAETSRLRDHTTPTIVQRVLRQIADAEDRPAFVYAHLMDAHHPYRARAVRPGFKKAPGSRGDYESEIAQIDADLRVLFDALEPIRARRPVLVVVTADHGEGFGEHGTRYHARDLHQTSLHVPLVFHGPGVKPGHVVDTPVDLLDVGVTLAVAGGVALPGAYGSSLMPLLGGGVDATNRPMFGELRVWRLPYPHYASVLEWPHKLIVRMDTGQHWLYDLAADPGERVNLWAQSTPAAERLDALLATWAEYGNGPAGRLLPEGLVEK